MTVIRLLLKLIALPVMLAVTVLQWVGIFLTGFSSVIFNILSGIIFLTAVLSFVFRIAPGAEVIKMLAIAFGVFIVPHIGEWVVDRIAALNTALRGFIRTTAQVKSWKNCISAYRDVSDNEFIVRGISI